MSVSKVNMDDSTFGRITQKDLKMSIDEFDGDNMSLSQSGKDSVFLKISKQADGEYSFQTNLDLSVIPDSFDGIKNTTVDQRSFLFKAENALNDQIKPRQQNMARRQNMARQLNKEATEKRVLQDNEQTQT